MLGDAGETKAAFSFHERRRLTSSSHFSLPLLSFLFFPGTATPDDNSILPIPNHVVLNHLTASAIRNGTLAVGTTTRYKRKVSSRVFLSLSLRSKLPSLSFPLSLSLPQILIADSSLLAFSSSCSTSQPCSTNLWRSRTDAFLPRSSFSFSPRGLSCFVFRV